MSSHECAEYFKKQYELLSKRNDQLIKEKLLDTYTYDKNAAKRLAHLCDMNSALKEANRKLENSFFSIKKTLRDIQLTNQLQTLHKSKKNINMDTDGSIRIQFMKYIADSMLIFDTFEHKVMQILDSYNNRLNKFTISLKYELSQYIKDSKTIEQQQVNLELKEKTLYEQIDELKEKNVKLSYDKDLLSKENEVLKNNYSKLQHEYQELKHSNDSLVNYSRQVQANCQYINNLYVQELKHEIEEKDREISNLNNKLYNLSEQEFKVKQEIQAIILAFSKEMESTFSSILEKTDPLYNKLQDMSLPLQSTRKFKGKRPLSSIGSTS